MQGLILSGIGMAMAGNSRPASGSEHHLSHFWEMKAVAEQRPEHFHGKKVGVGTAVMAKFYEKFFARDPFAIDPAELQQQKTSYNAWEDRMRKAFGPVANSVIALKKPDFQEWDEQRKTIAAIQTHWEQIKALQEITPSHKCVVDILQTASAASQPADIDIDADYLRQTLLNAHNVRIQHTVMTAARTLGWLEDIVDEIIDEDEIIVEYVSS
jgi:glycerol-1-phosphate dehydrogenase [NAD(P)+]